jgi:hypothetical protein
MKHVSFWVVLPGVSLLETPSYAAENEETQRRPTEMSFICRIRSFSIEVRDRLTGSGTQCDVPKSGTPPNGIDVDRGAIRNHIVVSE